MKKKLWLAVPSSCLKIRAKQLTKHTNSSVFQAEMLAILKAVELVINNNLTSRILSDSQAALEAVKDKLNLNLLAVHITSNISVYNTMNHLIVVTGQHY